MHLGLLKTKVDTTNFSGVAEENNTKQKQVENYLDWPFKKNKIPNCSTTMVVHTYCICLSTNLAALSVYSSDIYTGSREYVDIVVIPRRPLNESFR